MPRAVRVGPRPPARGQRDRRRRRDRRGSRGGARREGLDQRPRHLAARARRRPRRARGAPPRRDRPRRGVRRVPGRARPLALRHRRRCRRARRRAPRTRPARVRDLAPRIRRQARRRVRHRPPGQLRRHHRRGRPGRKRLADRGDAAVFYWLMKYIVIGPITKAIWRPWIVGRRNIPSEGAAILASNHLSFVDSVFLPLMIDRPVAFLAKSDYFTGRGIKGWSTRMFFKMTGMIPIDRSGGKASEASLNTGLRVLGRMSLEAHVPVVPVVMVDTDTMMPIGIRIPRIVRVGIVIGEPLDFSSFEGMEGDRYILRSVTDEIMVALQRLGEQEYDDVYASTVKDRLSKPARAQHPSPSQA